MNYSRCRKRGTLGKILPYFICEIYFRITSPNWSISTCCSCCITLVKIGMNLQQRITNCWGIRNRRSYKERLNIGISCISISIIRNISGNNRKRYFFCSIIFICWCIRFVLLMLGFGVTTQRDFSTRNLKTW